MMKQDRIRVFVTASLLIIALLLSACGSSPTDVAPAEALEIVQGEIAQNSEAANNDVESNTADEEEGEMEAETESNEPEVPAEPQLATATAVSRLSHQPGRAIVSARGNHFIVDSVPPIEGPNEELNPLDMMLSSLATCGIFVAERAAQELDIPLTGATARVEGDLDPSGVAGAPVDPRIQVFRVYMDLPGADEEQAKVLIENFTSRCPIYTTLSRSAPVEIITDDGAGSEKIEGLATAAVSAELTNQPGRAIVSARGNHFVIDSVPPLKGPNEERNPLDLMLGALATCGTFIYERVALEQGLSLTAVAATVEADFDPRGVAGEPVDPRLQALRVHMEVEGVDAAEADMMREAFEQRCPIYTTLVRAAPIEITTD